MPTELSHSPSMPAFATGIQPLPTPHPAASPALPESRGCTMACPLGPMAVNPSATGAGPTGDWT